MLDLEAKVTQLSECLPDPFRHQPPFISSCGTLVDQLFQSPNPDTLKGFFFSYELKVKMDGWIRLQKGGPIVEFSSRMDEIMVWKRLGLTNTENDKNTQANISPIFICVVSN